jgi:chlorobactene glucosyltransferase
MNGMKEKQSWWSSWPRLLLWSHVVGVTIFYIVLWLRTKPYEGNKPSHARLRSASPPARETGKTVSIIVPARDEALNIRRCVTSLLEQDYDNYEVIVVDDASSDGTGEILDEIARTHPHADRLWVLRLRDLPEGWAGKPHALHRGVQEAHGHWLLFTDADTWHAPGALRFALTRAMQEDVDLLSLGTTQELPGFWNKVMMPMAYLGISMQYPPKLVNDPTSPVAIANGQYILLRRAVYDILGGYARPDLRNTLVDDRDLAYIVKATGFRLLFVDGRDYVHVHMYRSLRETWHGWRKNVFLGSRGGLPFVAMQIIGLPMVAIVPFLLPVLGRLLMRNRRTRGLSVGEVNAASLLEIGASVGYRLWMDKNLRVPWYYAFTHPLAATLFEGILIQSAWRVLTGRGVDWRGRQYYDKCSMPTSDEPREVTV